MVGSPPCSEDVWRGQGRSEMMRYLFDGGYGDPASLTGWAVILAAKFGDIPYLEWLNENYKTYLGGLWGTLTLDAFKKAAEHGHVDVMEWMVTHLDELVQPRGRTEAMFAAAEKGKLNVVKWLYEKYSDKSDVVLVPEYDEVASNYPEEDSESFYYGLDKFIPVTVMDAAAQNGHVEVLQFLNEAQKSANASGRAHKKRRISDWRVRIQYPRCTTVAMDAAAEAGQLETVKWLHFNRTEGCTTAAMDRAAAYGHFEVVKWLHFNRSEGCTTFAIDRVGQRQFDLQIRSSRVACKTPAAVHDNQLAIVQWLHANRSEGFTRLAVEGAALTGNLKLLQWLYDNSNARCSTRAMDFVAGSGDLGVVKWLHVHGTEGCTQAAMDGAAKKGRTDVVKWLHENRKEGCTTRAMDGAARVGNLKLVKWLHRNRAEGCSRFIHYYATHGQHFEVAEYLLDNNLIHE